MSQIDAAVKVQAAEPAAVPVPTAPSRADPRRGAAVSVQGRFSAFWPLLLLGCAFTAWTAFQTVQLVIERSALASSYAQQDTLVANSTKLRRSLDAMAAQTQRLAEQGNPNARLLVDDLRRRGVTINAGGAAGAAPTGK